MTTRIYRSVGLASVAAAIALVLVVLSAQGADDPDNAAEPTSDNGAQIRVGDRLFIQATGTLPDAPINGVYPVEPSGNVSLGPTYRRVEVAGLTLQAAEARIHDHLAKNLIAPQVQLAWYDAIVHGSPTLRDRVTKLEKEVEQLRAAIRKR